MQRGGGGSESGTVWKDGWEQARGEGGGGGGERGGAPAGRRMVMPAPRAPVVLPLLLLLRVFQAQPCLVST